jgi:hypothetical protein
MLPYFKLPEKKTYGPVPCSVAYRMIQRRPIDSVILAFTDAVWL